MDYEAISNNIFNAVQMEMARTLSLAEIKEFSKEAYETIKEVLKEVVRRRKSEFTIYDKKTTISFMGEYDGEIPVVKFHIDYCYYHSWFSFNDTIDGKIVKNLDKANEIPAKYIEHENYKKHCLETNEEVTKELLQRLINDNDHILKNPERAFCKGYAEIGFGKLNYEREGSESMCIIARYSDGSYHQRIVVSKNNGSYSISVSTPLAGTYTQSDLWSYDLLSEAVKEAFLFITCKG